MQDAAATYPLPEYLTAGGRQAFEHEVTRYARSLGTELDRLASGPLDQRDVPEHTAKDVATARAAYEERLRAGGGGAVRVRLRQSRVPLLAALLLTASSVGIGVMPNFLDEPWQQALFALFIGTGVVGLVLTWMSGVPTRWGGPVAGPPPNDDIPLARHDG